MSNPVRLVVFDHALWDTYEVRFRSSPDALEWLRVQSVFRGACWADIAWGEEGWGSMG